MPLRVLLAGESWVSHTVHQKGFDSFTTTAYVEGAQELTAALTAAGSVVTHQPCHVAATSFPDTVEELSAYDCVILSDIGSNTLLLRPETFTRSVPGADRIAAIADYVRAGGGLVMIGGYLSFQGIEGKGHWRGSAVEEVLPVRLEVGDDRVEVPHGVVPLPIGSSPILAGISGQWPAVLGYNRLHARDDADVLASVGADPLLVAGFAGRGRAVTFASDCSPHWAPPPFLAWEHYDRLWTQIVGWAAGG